MTDPVPCPTCGSLVPEGRIQLTKLDRREAHSKSEKDAVRLSAELEFRELTGIRPPANKKAAGALWWTPLREIAELANWSEARARDLVHAAVKKLQAGQLTISDPNSILKTARALTGSQAKLPERQVSDREFLEQLRK